MSMRSPIVAMLWENWRLTRVEAAWRFSLGIVGGSAAILLFDAATAAFWLILWLNALMWFSIAKLNGGRFMDGYKPGFPFYLLYTRPVPTVVLVGVAVVYDAISGAVLYLVSAALVGFAVNQTLPLFSVIAWIMVSRLGYTCIQWSTSNRVVQWAGSMAFYLPLFLLLQNRVASPLQVEFSLAENAAMVLIGLVAFGLTVTGVARQRRGDAVATAPRPARSDGYPDWLVNLFRFPCPTSSATRAQVWFELKSSGMPVLAIGLAMAVLIFLLYAISIAVAPVRSAALAAPIMFGIPLVLLLLGGNAFGIRRRQGRTYASTFELTQPYGTGQMVSLKVMVRTACVLVALIVVGVSIWTSSSLVSAWGEWLADGKVDARPGLLESRQKLAAGIGGLTGYVLVAQAVILSFAVALLVASLATFAAVRARYPRRLLIAGALLLFHGLVLVLLALAEQEGIAPASLVETIFAVTGWTIVVAMVFATIYLFWRGFADRALTIRYVSTAALISAAFGAAWLTVLYSAGVQLAEMHAAGVVGILWPVLLPPLASVLAPWSLSRVRHT